MRSGRRRSDHTRVQTYSHAHCMVTQSIGEGKDAESSGEEEHRPRNGSLECRCDKIHRLGWGWPQKLVHARYLTWRKSNIIQIA